MKHLKTLLLILISGVSILSCNKDIELIPDLKKHNRNRTFLQKENWSSLEREFFSAEPRQEARGVKIPQNTSQWSMGGGMNPGRLGADLRSMTLQPWMNRNTETSNAPSSSGCP